MTGIGSGCAKGSFARLRSLWLHLISHGRKPTGTRLPSAFTPSDCKSLAHAELDGCNSQAYQELPVLTPLLWPTECTGE